MLLAALLVLKKLRDGLDGLSRLWLLCLISLGGTFLTGLLIQIQMREIYLFVWYPLVMLSLLVLLEAEFSLRRLLALGAVLLCLGNLLFSYGSTLRYAREAEKDMLPYRQFCQDADGALTAGFWGDIPFWVRESINRLDIYEEADNDTALYLFGPWTREYYLQCAEDLGGELTLFGEYGSCIAYRSQKQLMYFAPSD